MDDVKISKNNTNLKKFSNDYNEKFDSSLFDETLNKIEETLKILGEEKIHKQILLDDVVEEKKINKNEEHEIDNTHLKMDNLHNFSGEAEVKDKSTFGFYTYLFLIIGIIFGVYEALNIFKGLIISKYPITETYIQYFYEIIEILAYIFLNIFSFIKNLF
tara:strand:+ start:1323 stop:1802 length:480 start_codon:yes stop_codon:yes gene_type:complete